MLKRLRGALAFLTLLPVGGGVLEEGELGGMVAMFPAVGLVLGALALAMAHVLSRVFPPWVGAALLLAFTVVLTGAFHLDGLADVFDALALGRGRDALLTIMKESTVGVFGLSALVFDLMVKYGVMVFLLEERLFYPLVVAPLVGRWSLVYLASRFPSAREKGLGALVVGVSRSGVLAWASLWLLLLFFWESRPFLLLLVVVPFLEGYGRFWKRRVGGVTGDILGGGCEMVEVLVYLVILWGRG